MKRQMLERVVDNLITDRIAECVTLTVTSRSMLPLLAPGDRVVLRAPQKGEPRVGDLVITRNHQVRWFTESSRDICTTGRR